MKYISIIQIGQKQKTKVYKVINKKSLITIGTVKWYTHWRQYCFFPELDTIFSTECMDGICGYIKDLNNKHKEGV